MLMRSSVPFACLLGVWTVASAQGLQTSRAVGTSASGQEVRIVLPFAGSTSVESAVIRVSSAAGVPVGLEIVSDSRPRDTGLVPVQRNPTRVVMSGKTLGEAFAVILPAAAPPLGKPAANYQVAVREGARVLHVSGLQGRSTFLDQRVPTFEIKDVVAVGALYAVHRLFDSAFPDPQDPRVPVGGKDLMTTGASTPPPIGRALQKRISLSLTNTDVRTILDEIVVAIGDVSWVVRYDSFDGKYARASLLVQTFDGAGVNLPSRLQ